MPIKITGNISGSATLKAENAGSDVELTLPDHTGIVATDVDLAADLAAQKVIIDAESEAAHLLKPGRNLLINGGFQVWQRSSAYSGGLIGYNSADRWCNNLLVSVQRVDIQGTPRSPYALALQPLDASRTLLRISQGIELPDTHVDSHYFETMTFSAKVATTLTPKEFMIAISYRDVVNSTVNKVDIVPYQKIADVPVGTSQFTEVVHSFEIDVNQAASNNVLEVQIGMRDVGSGTIDASEVVYFRNVKLERVENVGDAPTKFDPCSYGEELLKCQRYYWTGKAPGGAQGTYRADAAINDAHVAQVSFPVQMASVPTIGVTTGATFYSCTHDGYLGTTTGLLHRVNVPSASGYRATNAVYYADAEL